MLSGSFCTGIGGLDLAVDAVFGPTAAWFSEIDPDASAVLAHRFPGVLNIGSLVRDRYDDLPPVDVITAGYPCQPFSVAGKRQGRNDDRHLWPHIADAIRVLRPRYVCLENVAGHLTLGFDRVLADLAAFGFDAEWQVVAASSVGAPHRRDRLYVLAAHPDRMARPTPVPVGRGPGTVGEPGTVTGTVRLRSGPGAPADAGTVRVTEVARTGRHSPVRTGRGPQAPADTDRVGFEEQRDTTATRTEQPCAVLHRRTAVWGRYAPAIARWEHVLGRAAPVPTVDGRLNPRLPEWMMGFPDGWCTDIVSRTAALRLCGNAVVPQAAAAAFRMLADRLNEPTAQVA